MFCDEAPLLFHVDAMVRHFGAHGKPTVNALGDALARVGRNHEPELLQELVEERLLTTWAVRRYVGSAWSGCEYPEDALRSEQWSELFLWAGYTVDGKRADLPASPLVLFRGASYERRYGWSWTDDCNVARWFADRSSGGYPASPASVWQATVEPWRLFARNVSTREGEPEYVVDTDDLDITECERVEPE